MLLGCIGDDFTGSSDLANTLARGGMRVVQYSGVPKGPAEADVEAGVVALKSRSVDAADAVEQSLEACEWLLAQGCRQIFFKYCSTFDSTPQGNIGPVIDALMHVLQADRTIVCPAFPAAGRSLFEGHLFVNGRLLNESGMEHHPLTPMTDPDIRRWLAPQTRHPVGHVSFTVVFRGVDAIGSALDDECRAGRPVVVIDAVRNEDLHAIGTAAAAMRLVTGGSGVALGLPDNFRRQGLLSGEPDRWTGCPGPVVVLAGSCSRATRAQVERHRQRYPAMEVDVDAVMTGQVTAGDLAAWAKQRADSIPLVYSSAAPELVQAAQGRYGRSPVADRIEALFAETARQLVSGGVTRLITAGGETSGAVVSGLGVTAMAVGPEIAPGVPAMKVIGQPLTLALKSGNFGGDDFFAEAATILEGA